MGQLAIYRNIFVYQNEGIIKPAKDAVKHPDMPKTVLIIKNNLAQNINSAEDEKPFVICCIMMTDNLVISFAQMTCSHQSQCRGSRWLKKHCH